MLHPAQRSSARGSCVRGRFVTALVAVVMASAGTACTGSIEDARTENETERMHLGRVHVLLEPNTDVSDDVTSESLEITARFAYVRGLEEELVRARLDMPVLPQEIVAPGECTPSDRLSAANEHEADAGELPELVLLDAGELLVRIGEDRVRVPLSLVPDLLPYMSGVEYLYYGDTLVLDDGAAALTVLASGSVTDELPPFTAEGNVPAPLRLTMSEHEAAELSSGALVVQWRGADTELLDVVTLRITGLVEGQARGAELTCVVVDRGQARFDLQNLRALGLAPDADAFRVVASRTQTTTFDAGDFTGSELVIERREILTP